MSTALWSRQYRGRNWRYEEMHLPCTAAPVRRGKKLSSRNALRSREPERLKVQGTMFGGHLVAGSGSGSRKTLVPSQLKQRKTPLERGFS